MNVKVCLIVLLCVLSILIVYSVATKTLTTTALSNYGSNNKPVAAKYLTLSGNGTQPDGDPKGGGGWPQ